MSRKTFLMAVTTALLLFGGSAATLFLLVRHEPGVYRRALVPPGPERAQRSQEFLREFSLLISAVAPGNEREWDIRLTAEQMNSYFAEGFIWSKLDKTLLPDGISEPRVALEPGKIRLAFKYGRGLWSSIVSIDFGVWLTEETNVVALEIQSIRAGSLPIGAHSLLDSLSEVAENNGIQVKWYRYRGNPVALLRFGARRRDTTVQLHTLQVTREGLIIRGKPVGDPNGKTALLPLVSPSAE